MTYKERYEAVIESGNYPKYTEKIEACARLIYNGASGNEITKRDALFNAWEEVEAMTGHWEDLTQEEFDDILNGIF